MHHLIVPLLVVLLGACAGLERGSETEIDLADVPDQVLAAARRAVPGIDLTGAEIEEDNGTTIYELEGEADGRTWEIEIDGTGEILEVEEE